MPSQPHPCADARIQGRFWIEDAVIDRYGPHIGAIGVAVYAYLARRADRQGVCFPSYQTVAQQLNLSRRTVITYVRLLEQHGLLVAATRGAPKGRRANAYRLVSMSPAENGAAVAPAQHDHRGGAAGSPFASANSRPNGATVSPVQHDHQGGAAGSPSASANGRPNGAAVAPMQHEHQGGAAGSPFVPADLRQNGAAVSPLQHDHQGGAADSPSASANGRQNGAAVAPVQHDHQGGATGSPFAPANGSQNGAAVAPVQHVHQDGAAVSPGMVQHDHQGGAALAPEGNTLTETQEKETQVKEKKNGALPMEDAGIETDPSITSSAVGGITPTQDKTSAHFTAAELTGTDEAAMMAALCHVTGKDAALLREAKRREYTQAADRLRERDFTAEDVRDFADYWRQAHPIGSKKPNAGYPHLVQVLEDLAGALPWIQDQRRRHEQEEAWQEDVRGCLPGKAPRMEIDPQARLLWDRIRDELTLRLPTPAIQADLHRARPISLSDSALLVELPSDATAEWWRLRLQRPVTEALARIIDHPLTVTFTGPTIRPTSTQWSPS